MQPENINITIGSDPEFVIMCGDSVENALEIFKRVSEMEHCCACPHPTGDDIANIYDSDKKFYIENVIRYINTKDLIIDYDSLAIETLLNIFDYSIKELLEIDEFEEAMLIYAKGYEYDIIKFLLKKDIPEFIIIEGIEHIEPNKLDVIREVLLEESEYLTKIYDFLSNIKKVKFDDEIVDQITEYLTNFDTLDNLPDEIQESIKQEIIDNYETDCESCDVGESYFCTTELGCDGQSALGEMRPKHGNNPIEHFNEILKLMEDLNDLLSPEIICYGDDELQVKAGTIIEETYDRYQLGGHIHIGFEELENTEIGRYVQKNIKYTLAVYVGVPLTLIEYTSEAVKRHSSYGSFASARNGEKYFGTEFRMPSSWLVSPQITIGALSLAYVVANEYIKVMLSNEEYKTKIYQIDENVKKFDILYEKALKDEYFTPLEKEMPKLYSEIQQMELYSEYKEYIDYIFDMIEKHKVWESETNILPRWAELW